jgi:hypothetical protein
MTQDDRQSRATRDASPAVWFKSSFSADSAGNCVEVAWRPSAVLVRDSKVPDLGSLSVPTDGWVRFARTAKGS